MNTFTIRLQGIARASQVKAASAEQAVRLWADRLPLSTWTGNHPLMVEVTDSLDIVWTFVVRPKLHLEISAG